jgi:large subunit ribosomal protein L24
MSNVKFKLKKNDLVRVIAGDSKGKEGKIITIDSKKMRATVEGVNLISKHAKPSSKNPNGGIEKKEGSIHISNLMLVENGKTTRIGRKLDDTSKKSIRYSKKTQQVIK